MKRLILILFMLLTIGCNPMSSKEISFIRENNQGLSTRTEGIYINGKRCVQDWYERTDEYPNVYVVFIVTKDKYWHAIISAFDIDKDGFYETVYFDTDGNGGLDLAFQNVNYNTQLIITLYKKYSK